MSVDGLNGVEVDATLLAVELTRQQIVDARNLLQNALPGDNRANNAEVLAATVLALAINFNGLCVSRRPAG